VADETRDETRDEEGWDEEDETGFVACPLGCGFWGDAELVGGHACPAAAPGGGRYAAAKAAERLGVTVGQLAFLLETGSLRSLDVADVDRAATLLGWVRAQL
jgi:hypothetical protein